MPRDVPHILQLGATDAAASLQREQMDLRQHVLDFHQPLFRTLRDDLRRWWHGHFVTRGEGEEKRQVWDPVAAARDQVFDEMQAAVDDLMGELSDEDTFMFEDELDAFLTEGFRRELWLLALGGLPADEFIEQEPDEKARRDLLMIGGIAGASWLGRLERWRDQTKVKTHQWLRASVIGERTLDDTLDGFDRLAGQFDAQIVGLIGNEGHRAYNLGSELALQAVAREYEVDEVWLTRRDALVCPVCEALHLTVTRLKPIDDTHPGCRCIKVPVPSRFRATPILYSEFVERVTHAETDS